jgi:hypothetical protein
MSDDKSAVMDTPTYIVSGEAGGKAAPSRGGIQKKHVLIGVSVVVVIGLIITGILVGMYIFSEAQKDIVKFSLKFKGSDNEDVDQVVESDPNDNVVMYHLSKPGQEVYVVNDFNKDMQIVKMTNDEGTNCYVAPLNRSAAMDPSQITGPDSKNPNGEDESDPRAYTTSNTPVVDRSFLTKKAMDMCKGVSLYWAYRQCGQPIDAGQVNTTDVKDRSKRSIYYMGTYNGLPGLGGCCWAYHACQVRMYESIVGGRHYCNTYITRGTCCSVNRYCWNYYYYRWRTPGLVC